MTAVKDNSKSLNNIHLFEYMLAGSAISTPLAKQIEAVIAIK